MIERKYERTDINAGQLHSQLSAQLGAFLLGVSTGPYGVIVHLASTPDKAQTAQIDALVAAHVPQIETPPKSIEERLAKLETDVAEVKARR